MIAFISDVHLGFYPREIDKQREDLLLSLLSCLAEKCKRLYIVGDLFDYWFEYKTVIPKYFYRTLCALNNLVSKGVEVHYIIGNHDFGHLISGLKRNNNYNFFVNELNIPVYSKDLSFVYDNKKFYLYHGDGLLKGDYLYLLLKSVVRNPLIIKMYSFLHPDCGISLAKHSSNKSRQYSKQKANMNIEDMERFACKKIDEGFDYVVMGHRHRAIRLEHNNGVYINLGDWLNDEPTFAFYCDGGIELTKVKEYLKNFPEI